MSRILFGDDDAEQRRLFEVLLHGAGHQVVLAASAGDVLDQLGCGRVDLLILDLWFPGCADGLELIRRLRESGCQAPILLLSGWPEEIYGKPEEQMVTHLMMKPVRVPELLSEIARLTSAAASGRGRSLPSASP